MSLDEAEIAISVNMSCARIWVSPWSSGAANAPAREPVHVQPVTTARRAARSQPVYPPPLHCGQRYGRRSVLYSGHPGRVWSTLHQHVQVTWVGLEDAPASYAVGFSVPGEEDTFYPALGLLSEEEFGLRERALLDSLASGKHLSGSVPPWQATAS